MNKQKLASTIWESANEMRSKIEANEYKDFILGFIFYKYLSESEVRFFCSEQMTDEDIKQLDESDEEFVGYVKDKIGYFIVVRNGDTLEEDWPFFEEGNPDTYTLTRVDAVVSNPPYSQKWDVKDKKFDPRFKQYGVAPKGKADYARRA